MRTFNFQFCCCSELLRHTRNPELQSCWRIEKFIVKKILRNSSDYYSRFFNLFDSALILIFGLNQIENHQSDCCEKVHELMEADIQRTTWTIHRDTITPGNVRSLSANMSSSSLLISKSKGGRTFEINALNNYHMLLQKFAKFVSHW